MAVVGPVFFDTSVLVGGLIDVGPSVKDAQTILRAVAGGALPDRHTAWHCVLEVLSVATRLPPPYRVAPADAVQLVEEEVLGRFTVHELGKKARVPFLDGLAADRVAGGRIYDAHIAEIARRMGAAAIVTDNPRHFGAVRRAGIRVLTSAELVADAGLR
jgi:predicted nucleic acid-binding protein